VDKTGVPLDHKPPNVIAKREQKKVRYQISVNKFNKKQITVVGYIHQCSWSGNPSFCHLQNAWIM